MRRQGTASATVLMIFVLGVTAVIGVFGLPQFEPAVASPDAKPLEDDPWSDDIASYRNAGAGEAVAQGVEDLFAPNEASAETAPIENGDVSQALNLDRLEEEAAGERQIVDLIGKTEVSAGSAQEPNSAEISESSGDVTFSSEPRQRELTTSVRGSRRDTAPVDQFDSRFGREQEAQPAVADASDAFPAVDTVADNIDRTASVVKHDPPKTEPISWRAAVARLNSLGIRKYRLTPGTQPNEFHFSCFFSPTDNPRITHRFEAEANEPLHAVQKVLAQVDQWRNVR